MAASGKYGPALQVTILDAISGTNDGTTYESIGEALAEVDCNGIGSKQLVGMWASGKRDNRSVGAVDVTLQSCNPEARAAAVSAFACRFGFGVYPLSRPATTSASLMQSSLRSMQASTDTVRRIVEMDADGVRTLEERKAADAALAQQIEVLMAMRADLAVTAELKAA